MPSCCAPGTRSSGTQLREGTDLPRAGEGCYSRKGWICPRQVRGVTTGRNGSAPGIPAGAHEHMPLWMPVARGCYHIAVVKQGVLSLSLLQ